jgi:hypothetical protein
MKVNHVGDESKYVGDKDEHVGDESKYVGDEDKLLYVFPGNVDESKLIIYINSLIINVMKTGLSLTAKIFACLFIAGVLGFWGCASMSADENGDNDTSTKMENGESPDESRIYNKWKFAGFVNGTAETVRTPEPPEPVSENNYWIIFYDDGTLAAKSCRNELFGEYKIDFSTSTISITKLGGTKMGEYGDGKLFVESLWSIQFFIIEKNSLKLYYNEKDYLLFNYIQP